MSSRRINTSCLSQIFFVAIFAACYSLADEFDNWSTIEDEPDFLPSSTILEDWADPIIPEMKDREGGKVMKKPDRIVNKKPNKSQEITETDLFLLGAIEKLAYRVDFLEKRVLRTEEIVYQLLAGNRVEEVEPCPEGFQRQHGLCYHFSSQKQNWKSSSSMCRNMGGILLELGSEEEKTQLESHLLNFETESYWTGGLNPGLLWLWGHSAKPVATSNSTEVYGSGRCLLLAYNPNAKKYRYQGADCAEQHKYICQIEDNTVRNRLGLLLRQRNLRN